MRSYYGNSDAGLLVDINFDLQEWEDVFGKRGAKRIAKDAGVELLKIVKRRFDQSRGPRGYRWKRLSKLTIRHRGGTRKPLMRSRKLYKSHKIKLTHDGVKIYTTRIGAKLMQEGGRYTTTRKQTGWMWHNLFGRKGSPSMPITVNVPGRPFYGFSKTTIKKVKKIARDRWLKSERLGKYAL